MNIERYILSETAKKRRRIVTWIEFGIVFLLGAATYVLVGLALRALGV